MSNQHGFVSSDHFDRDLYTSSQAAERVLNAAIVQAEIGESFEEFLEIFEAFYADDIEVSSDTLTEPIRGKARVRSLIFNFLVPLHIMAEVGGLSVSIREHNSGRCRRPDEFSVDARLGRCVRCNLHSEVVHPPEMGWLTRHVRASL
jgi:hypothetical protein